MSNPSSPDDPAKALFFAAVSAMQNGDADSAIDGFQKVLDLNPSHAPSWNNLGTLLAAEDQYDKAIDCFQHALEYKDDYAEAFSNLAQALHTTGDNDDALALYEHALDLDDKNPGTHNRIAILYKNMHDDQKAKMHFEKAIALDPDHADAHNNLGLLLWRLRDMKDAREHLHRAISLNPSRAEYYYSFISFLEFSDDREDTQKLLEQAKEHLKAHDLIHVLEARIARRDKDYKSAINHLEHIDKPDIHAHHEFAHAYDKLGRYDLAFEHITKANALSVRTPAAMSVFLEEYPAMIQRLKAAPPAFWKVDKNATDEKSPVFLVGFPRSGTTLLNQILSAHPEIVVAEEFPAAEEAINNLPDGYPSNISALDNKTIGQLRQTYFTKHKEAYEWSGGQTFIDESPLNLTHAAFLSALFPSAKFIFLHRHPCDVVLSCLFQKFQINFATKHFLGLETAANFYGQVMTLWQHYQKTLDLNIHTIRYEDLTANTENELQKLLSFLEVPWSDAVLDHTNNARQAHTASYAQVRDSVHTQSVHRWKNYEKQLFPVMSQLLPFAEPTTGLDKD